MVGPEPLDLGSTQVRRENGGRHFLRNSEVPAKDERQFHLGETQNQANVNFRI